MSDLTYNVDSIDICINGKVERYVKERTGHWIHPYYGLALPEHQCSECGYWEYADSGSNFCPNCGARMVSE